MMTEDTRKAVVLILREHANGFLSALDEAGYVVVQKPGGDALTAAVDQYGQVSAKQLTELIDRIGESISEVQKK